MSRKIRIIQVGLGPIGLGVVREIASREGLEIVAAVDISPALVGKDVGTLAGLTGPLGVAVVPDPNTAMAAADADVALITTASGMPTFVKHAEPYIRGGLHVVSSCEELCYPIATHPELSAKLDALAREFQVAVLGTGVNPGFLMDFLPLAVTGVLRRIDSFAISRIQDASKRRLPFREKIGAGHGRAEFDARVKSGVLRHVGLTESMNMIASALGWKLDRFEESIAPVIAEKAYDDGQTRVKVGDCLGVEQYGRASMGGREVMTLHFRATVGEANPVDRIEVKGEPPLRVEIPGGVNGDIATCAILVNAVKVISRALPGLRTMADSPLVIPCR